MGMLLRRHEEARQREAAALRAQDHKNALILEERRAKAALESKAAKEAQVMTVASVFHSEEKPEASFEEVKAEPEKLEDVKVEEVVLEDDAKDDESEVKVVKRGKKNK